MTAYELLLHLEAEGFSWHLLPAQNLPRPAPYIASLGMLKHIFSNKQKPLHYEYLLCLAIAFEKGSDVEVKHGATVKEY
eukprot:4560761-Amphidinium_carterae.1